MREIFESIYTNLEWGSGSGPGSSGASIRPYCDFLEKFIAKNQPTGVVDFGCGFFSPYETIKWGGVNYIGIDATEHCYKNNLNYANSKRSFIQADWLKMERFPVGDMAICKDVLQHWCYADIIKGLHILSQYQWVIIVNSVICGDRQVNAEIASGGFRPLDLLKEPICLPAEVCDIYEAPTNPERDIKAIILWRPHINPIKADIQF